MMNLFFHVKRTAEQTLDNHIDTKKNATQIAHMDMHLLVYAMHQTLVPNKNRNALNVSMNLAMLGNYGIYVL